MQHDRFEILISAPSGVKDLIKCLYTHNMSTHESVGIGYPGCHMFESMSISSSVSQSRRQYKSAPILWPAVQAAVASLNVNYRY